MLLCSLLSLHQHLHSVRIVGIEAVHLKEDCANQKYNLINWSSSGQKKKKEKRAHIYGHMQWEAKKIDA